MLVRTLWGLKEEHENRANTTEALALAHARTRQELIDSLTGVKGAAGAGGGGGGSGSGSAPAVAATVVTVMQQQQQQQRA